MIESLISIAFFQLLLIKDVFKIKHVLFITPTPQKKKKNNNKNIQTNITQPNKEIKKYIHKYTLLKVSD
jgi:hypothetical protein